MSGYIASITRVILNKITYTNSFLCSNCYHLICVLIMTIGFLFSSVTPLFPNHSSINHYKSGCSLYARHCLNLQRWRRNKKGWDLVLSLGLVLYACKSRTGEWGRRIDSSRLAWAAQKTLKTISNTKRNGERFG